MQIITDTAILARAKEFCDQNGTRWEKLTAHNRRRYLTRAREQLLDEDSGELIGHGLFRDPRSGALAPFSLVAREHYGAVGEVHSRNPLAPDQFSPRLVEFAS